MGVSQGSDEMEKISKMAGVFSWIGLCLTLVAPQAHLVAGSLTPAGGQTFSPGTRLAIHWMVEQEHSGNYQISYSPKRGTWIPILTGIRNNGGRFDQPMDTAWRIPDTLSPTTTARIRVWQSSQESGNGSASDSTNLYTLVSGNLTIKGNATPIFAHSSSSKIPRWDWNGSVLTVRAGINGAGGLSLYDGNGRLTGRFAARTEKSGLSFELPGSAAGRGNFLRLQVVDENGRPMEFSIPSASLQ